MLGSCSCAKLHWERSLLSILSSQILRQRKLSLYIYILMTDFQSDNYIEMEEDVKIPVKKSGLDVFNPYSTCINVCLYVFIGKAEVQSIHY